MVLFLKKKAMFDPKIENDLVLLRKMDENDFEELFPIAQNRCIWEHYPDKELYLKSHFRLFFNEALQDHHSYAIIVKKKMEIIGSTRFYKTETDGLIIGYTFLHPNYWGKGVNPEVKKLMIKHAFQFYDQVSFVIATSNGRSIKAIEKLGAVNTKKFTKRYSSGTDLACLLFTIYKKDLNY